MSAATCRFAPEATSARPYPDGQSARQALGFPLMAHHDGSSTRALQDAVPAAGGCQGKGLKGRGWPLPHTLEFGNRIRRVFLIPPELGTCAYAHRPGIILRIMPQDRTAILRMVPRKTLDEGLIRHNAGQSRPSHGRTGRNTSAIVLHDDRHNARTRLKELVDAREGVPGPKPDHCVDFIFAGPPTYAAEDAWDEDQVKSWAEDSFAWFRKTFPEFPVAIAAIHRDESSPHLHVTAVPETDGKLGWTRAQMAAVGKVSSRYSKIQDSYHAAVEHHGLQRGIRNADRKVKRSHIPLTAEAGIEAARRELETGRALRQEAEDEKREAAEQQARAAEIQHHFDEVVKIARDMGRHNLADAVEDASVLTESRLRAFSQRLDETEGKRAREMFRQERQEATRQHENFLAAMKRRERELIATFDEKAAEIKRQIEGWEAIARKKPLGYGRPLAHAGA